MALRVWLPLNGNLENKGLSNYQFINSGATISTSGKIGSCYSFDGTDDRIYTTGVNLNNETMTLCCWIKRSSSKTAEGYIVSLNNGSGYSDCQLGLDTSNATTLVYVANGISSLTTTITADTWHHIAITYDGTTITGYLDGIKKGTATTSARLTKTLLTIGARAASSSGAGSSISYPFTGNINDVRIYDECLSQKQIKEIAKGLVCHYKFDDIYQTNNLIINGYGELGAENWSNSSTISTTEIPSGHSEIKESFYGGTTKAFTPIYASHDYTINAYLKARNSSGYYYAALEAYDIDKKDIQNYQCSAGFLTTAKTTLSEPLSPGDTVIHATDLSQWSTSTSNNYYFVALFGYQDSTGFIYPDMEYTRDTAIFGTYSDKSNIDKTNNTITLLNAYTGSYKPAGTTICQSAAGSTWYYPFSGQVTTITDWTFATRTFRPRNNSRLKWAKYIKYGCYNTNAYHAGIQLIDNNISQKIIDTSGYSNNGEINGLITCSGNSPKYDECIYMPSAAYITHSRAIDSSQTQEWTITAWIKPDVNTGTQYLNNYNLGNRIYHSGGKPLLYLNSGTNDYYNYGNTKITAGEWTHIAFVFRNNDKLKRIYLNGENKTQDTGPNSGVPSGIASTIKIGENFAGYISDYREYATALSEEEILTLYKNSSIIDNNGNVYTREFKEV